MAERHVEEADPRFTYEAQKDRFGDTVFTIYFEGVDIGYYWCDRALQDKYGKWFGNAAGKALGFPDIGGGYFHDTLMLQIYWRREIEKPGSSPWVYACSCGGAVPPDRWFGKPHASWCKIHRAKLLEATRVALQIAAQKEGPRND